MFRAVCIIVGVLVVASFPVRRTRAQPVRSRVLEGFSLERTGGDAAMRIRFTLPVIYLRHSPHDGGDLLEIQLAPLAVPDPETLAPFRESLRIPNDMPLPIDSVVLHVEASANPTVEVRFERDVAYRVEQGRDQRSLVVRLPEALSQTPPKHERPRAPGLGAAAAVSDERKKLMQEGRDALTAGDFDRANALFTKLIALPEGPDTPDALELLALTRERKGQRAHAKAEYEGYLVRYPDHAGTQRVRQRLEALITASEAPLPRRAPLARRREGGRRDLEVFGSLYTGYRYDGREVDSGGIETLDSSILTDMHFETRLSLANWALRSQVVGGYRNSFVLGDGSDLRISSLFVEAESHEYDLLGSFGRRSRSSDGVLGRYDGFEAHIALSEDVALGVIGGLPVDSSWAGFGGFERYFGGVNLEIIQILEGLDVGIYGIAQVAGDYLDRAAVGAELRYFEVGRSLTAFLDYDVYHLSLNIAQFIATWQPFDSTYITLFGDYRNTPTLTTRNAIQGQAFSDLDSLGTAFSRSEIEALAKDRTARAANLSLSVSQLLTEDSQLAFDVGTSHLSEMPASGGVTAIEGTGFEFYSSGQLIVNDILTEGDVGSVGLRYADTRFSDTVSGTLNARYPLMKRFYITPQLRADYRMQRAAQDLVIVSPSLRLDLGIWKLRLDAQGGLDLELPQGGGKSEMDFFFSAGIRHDF